ncbi:MAG: hypothetical protein AABZ33_09740 [Chloroflexota bacterium]
MRLRVAIMLPAALLLLGLSVAPALATVHPIQSGDCNGFDEPFSPSGGDPPGITGQSNANANNFARPLFATGVLLGFGPGGPIIDFDNPALNGDNGNCPNGSADF